MRTPTGRWFIVMRPPGRAKTTTPRRPPDGSRLTTREQALIAKGQWEAQLARGKVAVGRERFETYWARSLRHAKGEMSHGSWEDVRAHGSKRLLPYFTLCDRPESGSAPSQPSLPRVDLEPSERASDRGGPGASTSASRRTSRATASRSCAA